MNEEASVSLWIQVSSDGRPPSRDLYHSLIEEELEEYLETETREESVKEALDLLWVCIGYYITNVPNCRQSLLNDKAYLSTNMYDEVVINVAEENILSKSFLKSVIDQFVKFPNLATYNAVKTAIFFIVHHKNQADYNAAWKELTNSNFSKFIPVGKSDNHLTEQMKSVDRERYDPYITESNNFYVIRDRKTNKILKPAQYVKANMSKVL